MSTDATLLTRLDALERENRRIKRAGALALVLATAAVLVAGRAPEPAPGAAAAPRVLRAEELELTTPDGQPYARIFLDGEGSPMLALSQEKSQAILTLNEPALYLRGKDGLRGAFVGFDTRGLGKIELTGKELDAVRMVHREDGSGGLYSVSPSGFETASLEQTPDGRASVSVRGERGAARGALAHDDKGNVSVVLLDTTGRPRVGMLVEPDGTPSLSLEDEELHTRMRATTDFDGSARLDFLRPDGAVFHRIP